MLRLKNIKRSNGIISSDYFPEGNDIGGTVSICVADGKVVEEQLSNMDVDFPLYFHHAVEGLRALMNKEDIPEEKIIMWY